MGAVDRRPFWGGGKIILTRTKNGRERENDEKSGKGKGVLQGLRSQNQ